MAHYSCHTPRLTVSSLPCSFSKQKLCMKLEEIVGKGRLISLDYITRTSARVTVLDIKAQQDLLRARIVVYSGGQEFQLYFENALNDSSGDEDSAQLPADKEIFTYTATDKDQEGVFRYLSKTDSHKEALSVALQKCGSNLISISEEEIKASLPKIKDGRRRLPGQLCEECIKDFTSLFSAWNEKLDDCSPAEVKYIISLLKKFKETCFGKWFSNSKIILIIGPREIVAHIKESVEKHLEETEKPLISPTAASQPFEYMDVVPAVMRFVLKESHFSDEMMVAMSNLAHVDIQGKEKLTVHVSPTPDTIGWQHHRFASACKARLKAFFNQFEVWKRKFDRAAVEIHRANNPALFETRSYRSHYIQWFWDTGTVNITGKHAQVLQYRQILENIFGILPLSPQKQSQFEHPKSPLQHGIPVHHSVAPISYMSGNFCDESVSPRSLMILFDTKKILPAVLKYVLNDSTSKKQLEKCCMQLAEISIRSDHGQLKVYVAFKQKDYSEQDKILVFTTVQNHFEKFDSQTKKYNKPKLIQMLRDFPELFAQTTGVYIVTFADTGTVKITGLKENVLQKVKDVDHEMNAEIDVESLPADIYIAQRECGLWEKVEEMCSEMDDFKISISPVSPGKIKYEGRRSAIDKAQSLLDRVSQELLEKRVEGVSTNKMEFLRKCIKSQHDYLETGYNMLDLVYKVFQDNSICGSLACKGSSIYLISVDEAQWKKGNELLSQMITCLKVDLCAKKREIPFGKLCKVIKNNLECFPTYVQEQMDQKKVIVVCFRKQAAEIKTKVFDTICKASVVKDTIKFYPMPEEEAKHILNQHNLYKAKHVEFAEQNGNSGLLVTCEQEDIDTVDMKFDELEIVKSEQRLSGYSLYENLTSDERHRGIERETHCSIFIKPEQQKQKVNYVTVKVGDILDEKCDAIVNSTGESISFSGQVSLALARKYGNEKLKAIMHHAQWIIPQHVCLCPTSGLFPWSYILNVATPDETELKKFILDLLCAADRIGIKSIALPTIGTGNMGLDPVLVAKCMKDAFYEFCTDQVINLKDIRVVVYDSSVFLAFKDIAPEDADQRSSGIIATIYGNSEASLHKAAEKLKEICDNIIKTAVIEDVSLIEFPPYVKSCARGVCHRNEVQLEWKKTGTHEKCHLRGVSDNVKRAEAEINKLINADFPHNWTAMDDERFVKVDLDVASPEYQAIEARFKQSSPGYSKILKIDRIQNPSLYKQFKTAKEMKKSENGTRTVTKLLFHGTMPDKVNNICVDNFDRNYAGENGYAYGKGVYFHINSSYSVGYTGQGFARCIFLAEVITGEYTKGSSDLKTTPEKGSSKLKYDSVVDDMANPTIYVVFKDTSAYPSYLITFQ